MTPIYADLHRSEAEQLNRKPCKSVPIRVIRVPFLFRVSFLSIGENLRLSAPCSKNPCKSVPIRVIRVPFLFRVSFLSIGENLRLFAPCSKNPCKSVPISVIRVLFSSIP